MNETGDYQHILWDWNGTLLNDVELCAELLNVLLRRHGLPLVTLETYRETIGFPIEDYYLRLGFDFSRTPFEKLGDEFMTLYRARWRGCGLQPGVREALAALDDLGLPQSILSATQMGLLRDGVAHFGIDGRFRELAALDNLYAAGKLEIGRRLVERLSVPPDRVLLIGDTLHDHEVAAALGIDCWLLTCGHHSRSMLEPTGAPLLESISEASARLDGPSA